MTSFQAIVTWTLSDNNSISRFPYKCQIYLKIHHQNFRHRSPLNQLQPNFLHDCFHNLFISENKNHVDHNNSIIRSLSRRFTAPKPFVRTQLSLETQQKRNPLRRQKSILFALFRPVCKEFTQLEAKKVMPL